MLTGAAAAKRAAGSRSSQVPLKSEPQSRASTGSDANIAALHAQMFDNPEAQKQLEQQILAIYAGADNQGK